jgi:3-carboxy-cis,cis-muconate cycloisomerase
MADLIPKLEVDTERMRENLEATRGLIFAEAVTMALAERLGKAAAHEIVESACERARIEKRHLRDIILGDQQATAHLSATQIDGLFDPRKYLGMAERLVDRVAAASKDDPI